MRFTACIPAPSSSSGKLGYTASVPLLFYNFNQGYDSQPLYGQRAYYNRSYYSRPGDCTPSRNAYFYRPYYRPRYYYGPAWQPGSTTTARAGAATEVGSRKSSGLAIQLSVARGASNVGSRDVTWASQPAPLIPFASFRVFRGPIP